MFSLPTIFLSGLLLISHWTLPQTAQQPGPDERNLGIALYRQNKFAEALPRLYRAHQKNPEDKEVVQLLGLTHYFLGQHQQAIPFLKRVQNWLPEANVEASYVLGISYLKTRDYPKALGSFATLFHVPPESAPSYLFLARILLREEFDVPAEEYVQKALRLDATLPLAHFLEGEIHLFKSRIPEAIQSFQKELELNPAYAPAYYKLGDAYSRLSNWEEAQRSLQRSLWLDASSTGPYVLLGKVHLKKGEPDLAARFLHRALSMDPNNYVAHTLLGQAFRALGKNDEADRELRLADELQKKQ